MKISHINRAFSKIGDPEKASKMTAYLKNKFEHYGIQAVERRNQQKALVEKHGMPATKQLKSLVMEMWQAKHREVQHFAVDLLVDVTSKKKYCNKSHKDFHLDEAMLKHLIVNKSHWDTVDMIAAKLVGQYAAGLDRYGRDALVDLWIQSGNVWLQRSCILFQLKYKEKTDEQFLFGIIKRVSPSDDFWIQKSTGWALRELSKTKRDTVAEWIEENKGILSKLAIKEGTKYINPPAKRKRKE